jgi:hypothetical protein
VEEGANGALKEKSTREPCMCKKPVFLIAVLTLVSGLLSVESIRTVAAQRSAKKLLAYEQAFNRLAGLR